MIQRSSYTLRISPVGPILPLVRGIVKQIPSVIFALRGLHVQSITDHLFRELMFISFARSQNNCVNTYVSNTSPDHILT